MEVPKSKTKLCKHWIRGNCRFSNDCSFAHGREELRQDSMRNKICKYWEYGNCRLGANCSHSHDASAVNTEQASKGTSSLINADAALLNMTDEDMMKMLMDGFANLDSKAASMDPKVLNSLIQSASSNQVSSDHL